MSGAGVEGGVPEMTTELTGKLTLSGGSLGAGRWMPWAGGNLGAGTSLRGGRAARVTPPSSSSVDGRVGRAARMPAAFAAGLLNVEASSELSSYDSNEISSNRGESAATS